MGFMCFGSSKQDDPLARKNADIEKQLRADQKKQAKEVKILLLGELYRDNQNRQKC
jgi:guanine nucleotide-binding protein subunit alpha